MPFAIQKYIPCYAGVSIYFGMKNISNFLTFELAMFNTVQLFWYVFRFKQQHTFPSKHSSWWRRTEDVFSVTFFVFQDVLKTSWRRLEDIIARRLQTRLEDVFRMSWKTKSVTLKTSWRPLEDVLENKKCLLGCFYVRNQASGLVLLKGS